MKHYDKKESQDKKKKGRNIANTMNSELQKNKNKKIEKI